MEVDTVKEMFLRSMDNFGIKYKTHIGDGDSQTFKAVSDTVVYGKNYLVEKNTSETYSKTFWYDIMQC